MKKSVREYIYRRRKVTAMNGVNQDDQRDLLECWPNIKECVLHYYQTSPEMRQYRQAADKPLQYECTEKFTKSLRKYCTSDALKIQLISAMTKIIYRIRTGGLRDRPIRERNGLRHFYVSDSWRVFYWKIDRNIILEEICPHKKALYPRRY